MFEKEKTEVAKCMINGESNDPASVNLAYCRYALAGLEQHWGADLKGAAAGSFNVGSMHGEGPAGSYQGSDGHYDPATKTFKTKPIRFKKFHSLQESCDAIKEWTRFPSIRIAAQRGSLLEFAAAIYNARYFGGSDPDPAVNVARYAYNLANLPTALGSFVQATQRVPLIHDIGHSFTAADARAAWARLFGSAPMKMGGADHSVLDPSYGGPTAPAAPIATGSTMVVPAPPGGMTFALVPLSAAADGGQHQLTVERGRFLNWKAT